MRNIIIKYLLLLWVLLLGVDSRANEFIQNERPIVASSERNIIVEHLSDVTTSCTHNDNLCAIEFFFENIEDEIEELESKKIHYSTQTQNYKPFFSHFGLLSNSIYYYLFNQNLKDNKKYILNCVYLL